MRSMTGPYEELLRERGYAVTRILHATPMTPGDYGGRVHIAFETFDGDTYFCVVEADMTHGRVIVWME